MSDPVRTQHVLALCGMCGLAIFCGSCGNNSCNAGYGKDGTCNDCPSTYEILQKMLNEPVLYAKITVTSEHVEDWRARQLQVIVASRSEYPIDVFMEQMIDLAEAARAFQSALKRAVEVASQSKLDHHS